MGTLSYRNRIFCNEKSSGLTDLDLTCAWLLGYIVTQDFVRFQLDMKQQQQLRSVPS